MAVIKAAASGNWSAGATWTGGVVPTLNDTVYANSFTVTLDQSIDLTGSTVDTSGSFIAGQIYMVVSLGTTNFALTANCIAPGTNAGTAVAIASAVGQIFQAVNTGTATTGTARRMGALLNYVNTPLTIATGGSFTLAANYNITGAYIQAGSANCLTVSAAASSTLAGCHATGSAFTLSTRAIAFSSSGTLTLNGIVAIGGRVTGTTTANGAHAIESTSAAGTIDVTNASTLTGGSGSFAYGINNNSTGTVSATSSTLTGGGSFAYGLNNNSTGAVTVTSTTVTGGSGANGICITNASTGTVTITSSTVTGGGSFAYGINNSGTGAVTVTSSAVTGGITNGICINNASTGTVTVTSSTVTGGGIQAVGITNSSTGSVTVTSTTVTGGSGTNAFGINNLSTGTITVTSTTLTGGSGTTSYGLSNASTGTIVSTGDITATNSGSGLTSFSTAASVKVSGSLISSANGIPAIYSAKYLIDPTPTTAKFRQAKNGSTTYSDFFTADNSLGQAAITDVRFGTVYASGALTGVAYIPTASSVAFGVPVDATTGTATLTAADVRAAIGMATANLDTQFAAIPTAVTNANAVWDELMSSHTTAGTYGGRIVRSTNANNELQLNAQNHAAANVHQFQAAVIESVAFATSAVTLFTGAMRTELTPELTEITEVHKIHGLDIANALTVTPTSRTSGAITQSISGDGTTNTVVTRV